MIGIANKNICDNYTMSSSGENPRGGDIEVVSRQICRLFALCPHCIMYFFGLFRARPTVLHTTLNGHLDTGVYHQLHSYTT